jgi:plasmid stabilization system protein ParE
VAEGFLAAYDRILLRIGEAPDGSAPHLDGTRRLGMMRFPYSIVYRVKTDVVEVVAVAHQRRRPGYWRERTK